ncbi:MAG: glycosyltransferase N-terminal domain-containing protein [Paracoccaceae bacterium]
MLGTFCLSYPISMFCRYLHRRMGADPKRFPERLGQNGPDTRQEVIWFHAASLGEVKQIGSLAEYLHQTEQVQILITTTTATGAEWVAKEMPYAFHRFAPIDTPSAVRRFLSSWSIKAAIYVEGDLWPRLAQETQKREIPQILLNARHSRTRDRLPAVFASLFRPFALVTCRSKDIADNFRTLGFPSDRLKVMPDLRLTMPALAALPELKTSLSETIGDRPIWLAASTHPADEDAVLDAHLTVLKSFPETLCIIAPRHPVRAEALAKLANDRQLKTAQRSTHDVVHEATQVYIADTLGELGALYELSPISFLGGSFGSEGGHNPYEPASAKTTVIYGPFVKNFDDAYDALKDAGAALQVTEQAQLGESLVGLMQDGDADKMARAGSEFMMAQQESISIYADLITATLKRQ